VLLIFGAPSQLPSLAGLEHGRTIPLADTERGSVRANRFVSGDYVKPIATFSALCFNRFIDTCQRHLSALRVFESALDSPDVVAWRHVVRLDLVGIEVIYSDDARGQRFNFAQ
jgi:hypothetical protein